MSMRIVVAVDGSPVSARVARHVVALAKAMRKPPAILLLVVDIPMMPGVERKIGAAAVRRFHEQTFTECLHHAREAFARAGLPWQEAAVVGTPAVEILKACSKHDADLLVMGSRGQGAMKSALVGSVAMKVVAAGKTPVTLVR
jgi:nucleotide-binding universal stress UspA family protein